MQILDVAVGLALIFFLFSVLVSTIQEMIASLVNWRGRGWEEAMQRWLNGSFTSSGIIAQRFRVSRTDKIDQTLAGDVLSHGALTSLMKDKRLPSYASSDTVSSALVDVLSKRANDATPTIEGLRWVIEHELGGNEALKQQLTPILQQAGEDLSAVRALIARAYDELMDRVSGRYKRFSQVVQLVLGLMVAVLFNVDAIYLAQVLAANGVLRAQLVEVAQKTVEEGSGATRGEAGAAGETQPAVESGAAPTPEGVVNAYEKIAALNLPIGWSDRPTEEGAPREVWFWRILGWLITAVALSQGAPFWFDLMANLVRVRGAGKKPESSEETAAKTGETGTPAGKEKGGEAATVDEKPANEFERASLSRDDILRLQGALGVMKTGILDSATRRAVRDKQRAVGMRADGKVSLELVAAIWSEAVVRPK